MGGETTWKSVKDLELRRLVVCHYAKTLKPTLVFGKDTTQLGLSAFNRIAKEDIPCNGDITRWLLHYWQWSDLSKWFGQVFRESLKLKLMRERAESHGLDVLSAPRMIG